MEEIIKKLKRQLSHVDRITNGDKDLGMPYFFTRKEIEQLLQALEWKGCDSCTHRMTGMCYYSKSFFYLIAVNETTSCIHHKKGE